MKGVAGETLLLPSFGINYLDDYDKALQEVKEQEDKVINDALKVMMAEAQDRNAAESFIKYHDLLPVHNWNTYTKYISIFSQDKVDFFLQTQQ